MYRVRSSNDLEMEIHINNEAEHDTSIHHVPLINPYNNQSDLGLCLGGKPREDSHKLLQKLKH